MRALLFTAVLITAFQGVAYAENKTTIGDVSFDFDAPSPPLTPAQQAFFQKYKDAVNRHDETALMALQDDSMKSCTVDHGSLLRELGHSIPDTAQVKFFPAADMAKEMGMLDMFYLPVQPTATLGIDSRTDTDQGTKIYTIFRPVRQAGDTFTFIPYCLTDKGKEALEKKKAPPPSSGAAPASK
jgi:hypothetical protein